MEFVSALWLPIVVSAVFVFIASSIVHMVLQVHKKDYGKLPAEETLMEAMRKEGVSPGLYSFPRAASMNDMGSPEMIEKYNKGPVGMVTVLPNGAPRMAQSLVLWFIYSIIVGVFCGYLAYVTLGPGAEYTPVFRVTGTIAVLGYGITYVVDSIWKGIPWSMTIKSIIEGAVYGLLTAGTFGWLWPGLS